MQAFKILARSKGEMNLISVVGCFTYIFHEICRKKHLKYRLISPFHYTLFLHVSVLPCLY